jgi:hypothetical protein
MPRIRSCPLGGLPLLALALACASPLAAQLERPPIGSRTPTLILAGPSWLSAAGFIPTRLILKWRAVPNAAAYQIWRSSTYEPRRMISEGAVANFHSEMETGDLWTLDYPVDMTSTYTYQVIAVFVDGAGTRTMSTPSPTASAKSPPYEAPTNFKYTVGLIPNRPGELAITFSWTPIPNAGGYVISLTGQRGTPSLPSTTVQKTPWTVVMPPKGRYNACIVTQYYPGIMDPNVRTCIDMKL